MAALDVFIQVGRVADSIFLATDVLPTLWQFSLGPLLDLNQFQAFMGLIKSLSTRIEQEQVRKLQELSSNGAGDGRAARQRGQQNGMDQTISVTDQGDFESLVTGRKAGGEIPTSPVGGWPSQPAIRPSPSQNPSQRQKADGPTFSWSTTPTSPITASQPSLQRLQPPVSRAITPDVQLGSFTTLTPMSNSVNTFSQPLQPQRPGMGTMATLQPQSVALNGQAILQPQTPSMNNMLPMQTMQPLQAMAPAQPMNTSINWSAATTPSSNNTGWSSRLSGNQSMNQTVLPSASLSSFAIAPPTAGGRAVSGAGLGHSSGLDKYESLL